MSALAELTELLHLAHTRPQKLRLEHVWHRHWGRLKVMGETWQQEGYGGLMYEDKDAVDETVQPQEETEYRTLSWWRGRAFRVAAFDEQRKLKGDGLTTLDYGAVFTPHDGALWEYTPSIQPPNPVDNKALDEPLLEPAFLLSAFTLTATGDVERAGRKALTLRAKPRGERSFMGPLGFDFLVIADELIAAVDAELGVLLALEVRFLGEVVSRLEVTKLEHPADFGPELTRLVVPESTTVMCDF